MTKFDKELLIIDGYNIINSWQELNEAMAVSLETARDKLIHIMADYSAQTGIAVLVVFDAHQVKGNHGSCEEINGIEVVFTKEGETADNYIEKVVDVLGREYKVSVATSDWVEQQIIMGRGAFRISARELFNEVKQMILKRRADEKMMIKQNDKLGEIIDPDIRKILEKYTNSR